MPDGTIGRLAVKGPTGCKYLQDERQEIYVQRGWNYPGDAYRRDADGYFWYVARTDDMIVSAGYNISGPEVEQALIAHADVKEVAVVAKRDPAKETNIVKAFVVLGRRLRRRRLRKPTSCASFASARSRRSRRRARSSSSASCRAPRPENCSATSCARPCASNGQAEPN